MEIDGREWEMIEQRDDGTYVYRTYRSRKIDTDDDDDEDDEPAEA